jgi:hypothetical protein
MTRAWLLPFLCVSACLGQAAPQNWHDVLHQIRENVAQQIVRANNYICVQDVSRYYYTAKTEDAPCEQPAHVPDVPLTLQDRLRLDVTVSEGNEIYAWHGQDKFSSKSLIDIVGRGPVSSGGFTGYLHNIFISAGVAFTYHPPTQVDGELTYKFDFHVPEKVSRYQIRAGKGMVIVPFHGWFTARADNLRIQTLTVAADGDAIPANAELCAIQSSVTYQLAHISDTESLIPQSFDMIYGGRYRTVTESRGTYTQCRQFSGESTVHFDTDETASAQSQAAMEAASLKPGLTLRIALLSEINSENAYAGMPLEGRLAHPSKVGNGVVLPAGTHVSGLLTRFETHFLPEPKTLLTIEFDRLSAGNKVYFFRAIHPPDLFRQAQFASPGGGRRGGMRQPVAYQNPGEEEPGLMVFPKINLHLDEKFVTEYETVSAK